MTNILIFKIENKLAFTKKKREDSYYCSRTYAFKIYWKLKQFPACSCNIQALFHCVVASVCPIIWASFPVCLIQSHSVHLLLLCCFLGPVLFVLLCLGFELLYLLCWLIKACLDSYFVLLSCLCLSNLATWQNTGPIRTMDVVSDFISLAKEGLFYWLNIWSNSVSWPSSQI